VESTPIGGIENHNKEHIRHIVEGERQNSGQDFASGNKVEVEQIAEGENFVDQGGLDRVQDEVVVKTVKAGHRDAQKPEQIAQPHRALVGLAEASDIEIIYFLKKIHCPSHA
jgi:hypothetical protein